MAMESEQDRQDEQQEQESDDGEGRDTWWYVCGTCNRAFSEDSKIRAHKWKVHKSKGFTDIRILSLAIDLTPVLKIWRCSSGLSCRKHTERQLTGHPSNAAKKCQKQDKSVKLVCRHCSRSFRSLDRLKTHVLVVHASDRKDSSSDAARLAEDAPIKKEQVPDDYEAAEEESSFDDTGVTEQEKYGQHSHTKTIATE